MIKRLPFVPLLVIIGLIIGLIITPVYPAIVDNYVDAADDWVSPTGHSDPDSEWNSEALAYDENTGTATSLDYNEIDHYLELTRSAIYCDKVRIYSACKYILDLGWHEMDTVYGVSNVSIDVYYSSAWHNIKDGTVFGNQWVEVSIGSTEAVTKARIKSNCYCSLGAYDPEYLLYEFEFNEISRPTVTTQAVSAITLTTATGNGNIGDTGGENCDKRGIVYDTSSHGDPGNTAPADSDYANYEESAGNYGTGAFTEGLASLGIGTTYYTRAYAHNAAGYDYGAEVEFTTLPGTPTVSTVAATDITTVGARLNALVDDDGGQACDVRFQYNTTSLPCNSTNATIWTHNTTWVNDTYITGQYPYNDTTGLVNSTTYFFRAQIRNDNTTQSGSVLCFTTGSTLGAPSDLKAFPDSHDTELSWQKGNNSVNTLVRAKIGSYPDNYTDGTEVYNDTSVNAIYEPLTPGITYYYRAWAESGGNYSANYTEAIGTTIAGAGAAESPTDPSEPSTWFATPDYTNLNATPLYPIINDLSDAYGTPNNTMWTFLAIILIMTIGVIIYAVAHQPGVAIITVAVLMWAASVMGLMPLWIAFVYSVPALSIMIVQRRT